MAQKLSYQHFFTDHDRYIQNLLDAYAINSKLLKELVLILMESPMPDYMFPEHIQVVLYDLANNGLIVLSYKDGIVYFKANKPKEVI